VSPDEPLPRDDEHEAREAASEEGPKRSKTSRSRRALRWGCAGLALLAVGLAGLTWFALGTEPGARWLFTRLGAIMPGELEVAELDGPIRGPLTVRGLRYASDSMEVTVQNRRGQHGHAGETGRHALMHELGRDQHDRRRQQIRQLAKLPVHQPHADHRHVNEACDEGFA
jgi:hypothetical protein